MRLANEKKPPGFILPKSVCCLGCPTATATIGQKYLIFRKLAKKLFSLGAGQANHTRQTKEKFRLQFAIVFRVLSFVFSALCSARPSNSSSSQLFSGSQFFQLFSLLPLGQHKSCNIEFVFHFVVAVACCRRFELNGRERGELCELFFFFFLLVVGSDFLEEQNWPRQFGLLRSPWLFVVVVGQLAREQRKQSRPTTSSQKEQSNATREQRGDKMFARGRRPLSARIARNRSAATATRAKRRNQVN